MNAVGDGRQHALARPFLRNAKNAGQEDQQYCDDNRQFPGKVLIHEKTVDGRWSDQMDANMPLPDHSFGTPKMPARKTRNIATITANFQVRFLFMKKPSMVGGPIGWTPTCPCPTIPSERQKCRPGRPAILRR